MTRNFRITFRHGIYFPIALLMCYAPATQASAFQTETKAVESDKPAATEQASPNTEESASDQNEVGEKPKSIKEQLDELAAENTTAMLEWVEEYKAAKTRAEVSLLRRNVPRHAYSAKLLELYEANPDDKDAQHAVRIALEMKGPKTATKASQALAKIASGHLKEARKNYIALAKFGNSTAQREAVNKLFEFAKEETDDAIALEILKSITGPRMRLRTEEAAEMIWDRVKANSEAAGLESLTIVSQKAGPEASAAAFDAMLEHYSDHEDFAGVLATVPSKPNEAFEAAVKKIAKTGEGDLQAQAAVSFAKYIKIRDGRLDRAKLSEEKLATLDQEKQDLTELLKTLDGDSKLHKEAQSELFEIEHLSPGAEAMDIVGTDLDGSELRLSDYRGKVVFFDFWGDW